MADWNNILIAVDETESSLRAVKYVRQVTRNVQTVSICLLHVYSEPNRHRSSPWLLESLK
jgi:hypothetical protein